MIERPILFSAPMVKALLAGTKTQTRRVCKPAEAASLSFVVGPFEHNERVLKLWGDEEGFVRFHCPYGQPGDRLYVRENAWQRPERTQKMMREGADTWPPFIYDADYAPAGLPWEERDNLKTWGWKRRPSIHLPRLGSRILLEITAVRVERLQDISKADAIAEGLDWVGDGGTPYGVKGIAASWSRDPRESYRELWEPINGRDSWDANPFCWVIEFRRVAP